MIDYAQVMGGVVLTLTLIGSAGIWVDTRYAYAEDFKMLKLTVESTSILQQLNSLEDRILREESKEQPDAVLLYKWRNDHRRLEKKYDKYEKALTDE